MIDKSKLANAAMSDEELDQVAGGDNIQTADDSRFLNVLTNGKCDRYGSDRIAWSAGTLSHEIEAAWDSVGITADVRFAMGGFGGENRYYIKGTNQELTQEEARQYAMNFVGRQLKRSDWDW